MTLIDAYEKAASRGHQEQFCIAFYTALKKRMSEQDAVTVALSKIEAIAEPNDAALSRAIYANNFQKALDNGANENQARMIALQEVSRRRG